MQRLKAVFDYSKCKHLQFSINFYWEYLSCLYQYTIFAEKHLHILILPIYGQGNAIVYNKIIIFLTTYFKKR